MKKRKPRLSLNRETIRALDPALVGWAKGGITTDTDCCETNDSEMNNNCYPTNCSLGGTGTGTRTNYTIPQ